MADGMTGFGMNTGMPDLWTYALASLKAANDPQFAAALDAAGVPPPPTQQPKTLGGVIQAGTQGAMQAQAPTVQQPQAGVGMPGFKGPAPVQPLMRGGVTGGVKPPDQAKIQVGSPVANALLAASLSQGQTDPLRVPTLGALMRGGGR